MYKELCYVLTNHIDYLHSIFHEEAKARILKPNSVQNSSIYIYIYLFFFQNASHKQQNEIVFITFTYNNSR